MSRPQISKIVNNNNYYGNSYTPSINTICAVCVGLNLNREKTRQLFFAAFPGLLVLRDYLDTGIDIHEYNEILYNNGLPLWGANIQDME